MPEGDTIWRAARTLEAALAGHRVTAFFSSLPSVAARAARLRIVGRRVERVESRGKHLLLRFEGGATLHTHLGMHGAWRIRALAASGAEGAAPRRGPERARIEAAGVAAVCLGAPIVELLPPRLVRDHPALARLGPDVLSAGFDPAAALARLRSRAEAEIGVALLDQTALAGIGNVYKSEALFLCAVPPRARVRDLDAGALERLVDTARRLMRRNLGGGPRRTTTPLAAGLVWVYRRAGAPCRRCGAAIVRIAQGTPPRSTYLCPRCQAAPEPATR